jgi:hypothetical protein
MGDRQELAGRDRSPTAASESHGLQNEVFDERPLRRKLAGSPGSGTAAGLKRLCDSFQRDPGIGGGISALLGLAGCFNHQPVGLPSTDQR